MRHVLTFSILSAALLFSVAGCERPEDPMLKVLQSTASQTRVDDLSRTMDFVFSENQFDQTEFNNKVSLGLNRWASYSDELFANDGWKKDESLSDLLEPYEDMPAISRIGESSFLASDSRYLQATVWLDMIKTRVEENPYLRQYELYRLMADSYEPDEDEDAPVDAVSVSYTHLTLPTKA